VRVVHTVILSTGLGTGGGGLVYKEPTMGKPDNELNAQIINVAKSIEATTMLRIRSGFEKDSDPNSKNRPNPDMF
jgi:hypothetical protein